MAKASNVTLPVLLLLVAIGAAVVFIGPSLTGLPVIGTQRITTASNSIGSASRVTYLYPLSVSDSDNVDNADFAVSDNNPNYAVLHPGWANYYTRQRISGAIQEAFGGVLTCPSGFMLTDGRDFNRELVPNFHYCRDSGTNAFSGWFSTINVFQPQPTTGSPSINPINITAIQVSASDVPSTVVGFTSHSSYVIFVRAKCTGSSGAYSDKFLGTCNVRSARATTCAKTIGTAGCPSGKWTVNRVIVGNAQYEESAPATGGHYGTDSNVHWIRLVQSPA